METLINLVDLKQQLSEQIGNAYLSDCELPEIFKNQFVGFGDYKVEEYYKYTFKVSSRKSVCYIPNQWVYIATICSNYCIELKKYKQKLKSIGITDDDFEACHPSSSDKTITEEKRSNEYVSQKAKDLLSSYDGEDKDLLISFLWDYDSWGGGKNIKRDNDFTISPCLNVANSINSSSSLIGDIAKAIGDNTSLYNILTNSAEMAKLLKGIKFVKKELVRVRTAAGFIKEALKMTLTKDYNFSLLERTRKYSTTEKSLFINGYWLGRDKTQMPSRESDVYTDVEWSYNNKDYVLNVEITTDGMENKLFPVFNEAYKNRLRMEKDVASGEYVLYEILSSDLNINTNIGNIPLQKIFYGAPGTGKSNTIKNEVDEKGKANVRTTFHPDSDYSTFVGAYKPTMKPVADKYKAVAGKDEDIAYEFVPQAFLQAYVNAWKLYAEAGKTLEPSEPKEQYLIIEEINRGNCAQIFGDLFQLLDRGEGGYSDYFINSDKDIQNFLEKELGEVEIHTPALCGKSAEDISKLIKEGKILLLPKNLYIWATMNTSDQSLFPIDSAFKRRWDWVYKPIGYKNSNWTIEIGDKKYNWVDFQKAINQKIYDVDNSEDKQLGDYFVNADRTGNKISANTLLNKILFYIWNDVCKDDPDQIFRCKTDKGEESVKFSDFFGVDRDKKLQGFMTFNGITAMGESQNTPNAPQETEGIYTDATPAEEENDEINA